MNEVLDIMGPYPLLEGSGRGLVLVVRDSWVQSPQWAWFAFEA